jgi:hypothetical protein
MTPDYIEFIYNKAKHVDAAFFLRVATQKKMISLVDKLLSAPHNAVPDSKLFLDWCIPTKADDPNTATYIQLAQLFLARDPDLVHMQEPTSNETPLFKACERGSLPHVKLFATLSPQSLEVENSLGNTPLWIACAKRYPCIFCGLLCNSLAKLPPFEGECYVASNNVNRTLLTRDKMFCFPTFISASLLFHMALKNVASFSAKPKPTGTVFILKSKTGKFVAPFSTSRFDAEVVFPPMCKFQITNFYRGDVICLGQKNIREHTFKITDQEAYLNSNQSLIVELEEM